MPALQPPSRTATPTPIDALLAPLHLAPPTPPTPTATQPDSTHSTASGSGSGWTGDLRPTPPDSPRTANTLVAGAAGGSGLRSRKSAIGLATLENDLESDRPLLIQNGASGAHAPGLGLAPEGFDAGGETLSASALVGVGSADATRPALRRAANDALASSYTGASSRSEGRTGKGKGKAVDYGGELEGDAGRARTDQEREVIVHKVLKTDSIASLAVKYGISPPALRASNRLWPSDPLFLRTELLIPLDQCHLPTLAQAHGGIEGLAEARRANGAGTRAAGEEAKAEEGEDLMRWDAAAEGEPPPTAANGEVPASGASSATLTPRESSEFLAVWDEVVEDGPGAGAKALTPDLAAGGSATTPNPFAAATTVSTSASGPERPAPQTSRPFDSSSTLPRSASDSPRRGTTSPSRGSLRIKRLPASQLAFFPEPSLSPRASLSSPSSPGVRPPPRSDGASEDRQRRRARADSSSSSSLFFRPLAKQLGQLALPLPSFLLPSSSTSTSSPGAAAGGSIRLPPSPLLSPAATGSSGGGSGTWPRRPAHARRDSSATMGRSGGGGGGWSLLDFGAEADEADQVVALRQLQGASAGGGASAGVGRAGEWARSGGTGSGSRAVERERGGGEGGAGRSMRVAGNEEYP